MKACLFYYCISGKTCQNQLKTNCSCFLIFVVGWWRVFQMNDSSLLGILCESTKNVWMFVLWLMSTKRMWACWDWKVQSVPCSVEACILLSVWLFTDVFFLILTFICVHVYVLYTINVRFKPFRLSETCLIAWHWEDEWLCSETVVHDVLKWKPPSHREKTHEFG